MSREGDRFTASLAGWYRLSTGTGERFVHLDDGQVAELGLDQARKVPGYIRAAADHSDRIDAVVEAAEALVAWWARNGTDGLVLYDWQAALVAAVDALNGAQPCICRPRHRDNDPVCRYRPGTASG